MGLAASQARLLFITSRQNDVSAKMQRISNDKLTLARDEDDAYEEYNRLLNKSVYKTASGDDLSYDSIMGMGAAGLGVTSIITSPEGRVVLSNDLRDKLKVGETGHAGDIASKYPTANDLIIGVLGTEQGNKVINAEIKKTEDKTEDPNKPSTVEDLLDTFAGSNFNVWNGSGQYYNHELSETQTSSSLSNILQGKGNTVTCLYSACNSSFSTMKSEAIENLEDYCKNIGSAIATAIVGAENAADFYNEYLDEVTQDIKSDAQTVTITKDWTDGNEVSGFTETAQKAKGKIMTCSREDAYNGSGNNVDMVFFTDLQVVSALLLKAALEEVGAGSAISFNSSTIDDEDQFQYSSESYSGFRLNKNAKFTYKPEGEEETEDTGPDPNSEEYYRNLHTYYDNLYNWLNARGWVTVDSKTIQSNLNQGYYSVDNKRISESDDYVQKADKEAQDRAKDWYDNEMRKLKRKEDKMDTDLQKLQTEYQALTTDYQSVKSIIDANIQKSFTYCSQ